MAKGRSRQWKVDIPASVAGRRLRRFFSSKIEAENYASDFLENTVRGGVAAALDGFTVGGALRQYMAAKAAKAGQRHRETLKRYEKLIQAELGHLPLAVLRVRDVERFASREQWSKRTQWNAFSYLRSFLSWCRKRDLMDKNPAEAVADEWERPEGQKEILSVEEMKLLLGLTKRDPVMRAFVVLGGFAGLRSAEIMRIEWADVNREEREIHVRPGVIKKTRGVRERFTTINATCLRWLPRKGTGRIIPLTQRSFQRRSVKLCERMLRLMERLERSGADRWQEWPHNCLRHSFASYLLAVKQDAAHVAYQMGHTSPTMVHRAYARAVRKAEAVKWWSL